MKGRVMKRLVVLIVLMLSLNTVSLQAGDIPHGVAGFTLGHNVAQIKNRLQMETVLPLRYREYLREVEIAALPEFKSGVIVYGTCEQPGRIVRIKLKYADASRAFYDALLERVEMRFGKPTSYEGDPFHIVIEWKWSFIAADGNRITMHLSHNNRDTEEKFGNAIKLTLVSAMNKERQCFRDKAPQAGDSQKEGHRPLESLSAEDWKALLPN